mgnify:CR=1 FL=1
MEHVTEQQLTRQQSPVWRALRAAAPQTIPVLAGYFVLGMGYGIYVQSLGLPVWMPMLMGTVVYGGSLEFVLASLLLSAFSPLSAFLMALMIQARHLFYGLAMLERYKGYGLRSFYMIFAMSDETFSITCSAEPPEGVDRGWFMFFITLLNTFVGAWNSWYNASIYVPADKTKWPIQLFINEMTSANVNFLETATPNYSRYLIQFAVIVVATLPIMVAMPFFQDKIEAGQLQGGVKG